VNFLRSILFGGLNDELEEILSEGQQFVQCENIQMLKKRARPRINLIPINQLITNVHIVFFFLFMKLLFSLNR